MSEFIFPQFNIEVIILLQLHYTYVCKW